LSGPPPTDEQPTIGPIRVLLVDDDDGDFALVEALVGELDGDYELDWAGTWTAGLAAMEANHHDLYLVDHGLGARTGIELLEAAAAAGCRGPRILVTGNRDPRLDRLALSAGAVDFLYKQTLSAEALDRTLRYALERDRLMNALQDQASQMAGGIAHDFNNMLMGVVGSLDLAACDATCSQSVRQHLRRARASAERASELSTRLLAYARRRHVEAGVVDVTAILRELQPLLERRVGGGASLTVRVPDDELYVGVGEGELEEIVVNLVANAANALRPGGSVEVALAVEQAHGSARHRGTGEVVRITVEDDGAGMPADVAARVFEPFFTTRRGRGGTGLGLAMVHDIVTRRGGRIELESRPGRGTRFDLLLPRVSRPAGDAGAGARAVAETPTDLGLVLVVDDEHHIREILEMALSAAGATVLVATDAETALTRLEREGVEPDLLITDVTMPGMSGFDLRDELARSGKPLPTLYITGYGADALRDRPLDPTMERLLDKPFRLGQMFERLAELRGGATADRRS
jgi:two-component system, cell cycle sensor histidine kinase and response regulator CckA